MKSLPKKLTKEWVERNGYGGLRCPGVCGCTLENFHLCAEEENLVAHDGVHCCFPAYAHEKGDEENGTCTDCSENCFMDGYDVLLCDVKGKEQETL
jgi:hypothetical protein